MKELYNDTYAQTQLAKYKNRNNNHFRHHIQLAKELVSKYCAKPPAKLLDIGCSIGTFALEFALDGYKTIGLDFDQNSLNIAQNLAKELGCSPQWICADAGNFCLEHKVDIVICFDLFEHLDDDTIGKMLKCINTNLKKNGIFVFHTFPTEYDHIFYKGRFMCIPLIPFRKLSSTIFEKLVKIYALFLDVFYILRYRKSYKKKISNTVHPNPLSEKRLESFLNNTGFKILYFNKEIDKINPLRAGQGLLVKKYFSIQPVAYRSLFGVARKEF